MKSKLKRFEVVAIEVIVLTKNHSYVAGVNGRHASMLQIILFMVNIIRRLEFCTVIKGLACIAEIENIM